MNQRSESACLLVERTLNWLIQPHIDLGVRQLSEAVSLSAGADSLEPVDLIDSREIFINCGSLIRCSADGSKVQFAHFSVEEYLRTLDTVRKPHLSRYRWDRERANAYKAEICLTALNLTLPTTSILRDFSSMLSWLQTFPFYLHAALAWHIYACHVKGSKSLGDLTIRLFCSPREHNFDVWKMMIILNGENVIAKDLSLALNAPPTLAPGGKIQSHEPSVSSFDADHITHSWLIALSIADHSTELHFAAMLHLDHLFPSLSKPKDSINQHSGLGTPLHCLLLNDNAVPCSWRIHDLKQFIRNHVSGAKTSLGPAMKTLLDLGAEVNLDYRKDEQRRISTTYIAFMAGVLEPVMAAGAVLDGDTADLIQEDSSPEKFVYLRNLELHKIADNDLLSVARMLTRLADNDEGDTAFNESLAKLTKDENFHALEWESLLWDCCQSDDLGMYVPLDFPKIFCSHGLSKGWNWASSFGLRKKLVESGRLPDFARGRR